MTESSGEGPPEVEETFADPKATPAPGAGEEGEGGQGSDQAAEEEASVDATSPEQSPPSPDKPSGTLGEPDPGEAMSQE